jgi:hypothetical protein
MIKIISWLKKYPWAIIVALGSVLGAIAILISRENQVSSIDGAVQIRAAIREIAKNEASVLDLEKKDLEKKVEIEKIEKEIASSKKRVLEIHKGEDLSEKSDEDISRLFNISGF